MVCYLSPSYNVLIASYIAKPTSLYSVTEEKFLHQIHLEEQFGSSTKLDATKDKKRSANNAAIGYNYETEEPIPEPVKAVDPVISEEKGDDEDSDVDLGTVALFNILK